MCRVYRWLGYIDRLCFRDCWGEKDLNDRDVEKAIIEMFKERDPRAPGWDVTVLPHKTILRRGLSLGRMPDKPSKQ